MAVGLSLDNRRQPLRRVRVLAVGAALLAVLAGCQVDANVDVTMAEDGSGAVEVTVLLDADAAARVPDLAEDLRVRDLEATGWEVTGPTETDDGGVEILARKPFANVEQGRAVLREIGGRGGLLRALTLRRDRTFAKTSCRAASPPSATRTSTPCSARTPSARTRPPSRSSWASRCRTP
jgi:hypothetical protein